MWLTDSRFRIVFTGAIYAGYTEIRMSRSLSDLGDRNEEVEERGQILVNLGGNSGPIHHKFGDIWAVPPTSAVDHP